MRHWIIAAALLAAPLLATAQTPAPTIIGLTGEITRADFQTYKELPFTVPPGVARITVSLSYEGRDQKTVIDLGLRDPDGQRGWSGGNKSTIVIDAAAATPSYRAGPITPGTWYVVIGIPNIREGVVSKYQASVTLETVAGAATDTTLVTPVNYTEGFRRGDFHTHTAHSDGSCEAAPTKRIPCPVYKTLDAARAAHLDFIAVTDHNTLTQANDLRELQPAYPDLLIIPGMEVTTFKGHANAVGLGQPVDFQLGSPRLPTLGKLVDDVNAQGGFLSINHPSQPSGESCMGCGWTWDTDWSRVTAIEAANGSTVRMGLRDGPVSGLTFWEARLNEGFHITAIGGSDNHDASDTTGAKQSPVGSPATVVWAKELSAKGIVDGVKSGRVFIDMENKPGREIDILGNIVGSLPGDIGAHMGETLQMAPDQKAYLIATARGVPDARIQIVSGGVDVTDLPAKLDSPIATFSLKPGAKFGWIRVNVRDADGKLQLVSNAVYVKAK